MFSCLPAQTVNQSVKSAHLVERQVSVYVTVNWRHHQLFMLLLSRRSTITCITLRHASSTDRRHYNNNKLVSNNDNNNNFCSTSCNGQELLHVDQVPKSYHLTIPPPKEVMFSLRSVCLFVCPSDNWKSCERIMTKFLRGVGHGQGPRG